MHRNIARRLRLPLLATALLIAAIVPAGALARAPKLQGIQGYRFQTYVQGNSVAIAPSGIPWFGTESESGPAPLARVQSKKLSTFPLWKNRNLGSLYDLTFDPSGALWFAVQEATGSESPRNAIGRRAVDGAVTETALPGREPASGLAVGPEGDAWFTSGQEGDAAITRVTASGELSRFPLPAGTPGSVAASPDGAIWFAETLPDGNGAIGSVSADGSIHQYLLEAGVEPRALVAGPDGSIWFSENGAPGPNGATTARIGKINTAGEVSQFPIPFGESTIALAVDPSGRIWFTTQAGELSSISGGGAVGGSACFDKCDRRIIALAVAGDGSIWFAAGHASCSGCGGSASLMAEDEGTEVGKIPAAYLPGANAGEVAPVLKTLKPDGVTDYETLLMCEISPHGHEVVIRFEWGRTKHYNHTTYYPEDNPYRYTQHQEYEEWIDGLRANTTYHYRAVATYDGKKIYGKDVAFTTKR